MNLGAFSTLSFDCYGTLIDWETGLLAALRPWLAHHAAALDDEQVLSAFAEAESTAQAAHPQRLYPDILADAFRALAARWSLPLQGADVARFASSVGDWPAFADSAPALAYLASHYRLVILSNVDRASFARSNAKLGVVFDHVFTAQEIGSYKPDVRNFEYMLERLAAAGVASRDVLHVAQSLYHDHVPAKRLGLASVWVNRRAGRAGSGATRPARAQPDLEVASLAQLVELHRSAPAWLEGGGFAR